MLLATLRSSFFLLVQKGRLDVPVHYFSVQGANYSEEKCAAIHGVIEEIAQVSSPRMPRGTTLVHLPNVKQVSFPRLEKMSGFYYLCYIHLP